MTAVEKQDKQAVEEQASRLEDEAPTAPRIYLAGASKELELCEHWRDELRRAGFEITRDWMAICREPRYAGVPPEEIPRHDRRQLAENDLAAVRAADAFWLVVPPPGSLSVGMWVELGFALRGRPYASPARIVISGPWRSIFCDAVRERETFEEHARAFAYLCDLYSARLSASAAPSAE